MSSLYHQALQDVLQNGKALLKFITANDLGLTGANQAGFYLPKLHWRLFTPHAPVQGRNSEHRVEITWPDGAITQSVVKWYGTGTRSEYRITRFGRKFRWREARLLGGLLVLVPHSHKEISAYIVEDEEEIEELQAELGVEAFDSFALYSTQSEVFPRVSSCLSARFRAFAAGLTRFPSGRALSDETRSALLNCDPAFAAAGADDKLFRLVREEYSLFRRVESQFYEATIIRGFRSIPEFLKTAQHILQSRKARAGRSLENHVETMLREYGIPFEMRALVDNTRPDIIIPGAGQYLDRAFPEEKLFVVGVKTTCKDRWRQVLKEAPRVTHKHLLTMQKGISTPQITEIVDAGVTLVVPRGLHRDYPSDARRRLMSLTSFLDHVKASLAP